mmetsp:Transcript_109505/g.349328  ORF Transcript_109505/g.349328 Transcript_109505/m.349328 type:complete len:270 (-) Transcript_109505:8-817(-)
MFSCAVYGWVRQEPERVSRAVSGSVLSELALNVSLMAFWSVDLTRPWLPLVAASDASPAFGYGFCLARSSPDAVRDGARHAALRPHHFRLRSRGGHGRVKARAGPSMELPVSSGDFRVVFSIRAKQKAHSGEMEARGALMGIKRILRSRGSHRHRALFLVDAQSPLGALQKGRSSAPTLRRVVSQAAAASLAGDLKIRWGYLPSESNPADAPSRGKCMKARRKIVRQRGRQTLASHAEVRLRRLLAREGLLSRSSDFSSEWSGRSTAGL